MADQQALTFRDFRGGWNTAEDSADLIGWRRMVNLRFSHLANGATAVEVRPPVGRADVTYLFEDLFTTNPNTGAREEEPRKKPNAGHGDLANFPSLTGYQLKRIVLWTSGLITKQNNCLLIYRSFDKDTSNNYDDEYSWKIYTNAPYLAWCNAKLIAGGTENAATLPSPWTLLDTVVAPMCNYEVLAGDMRILLGPRYDYRILTYVSDADSVRTIFNGTGSAAPITLGGQYNTNPGGGVLGSGGAIYNGWLYDYGKLYQHWNAASGDWQVTIQTEYANGLRDGLGLESDDAMTITFIIAPVMDLYTRQIGIPYIMRIGGSAFSFTNAAPMPQNYFSVAIAAASTRWNYRITEFAIYLQIESEVNGLGGDARYVGSISVADDLARTGTTISTPTTVKINRSVWGNSQRTWATDASLSIDLGRDLPAAGTGGTFNARDIIGNTVSRDMNYSSSTDCDAAEALITIRPKGMVFHKKTNYAWAVNDDASGVRIRQSGVSGALYHPDVFDVALVTWKPDARWPVTRLVQFNDRILELHETGVYYIDTPEYPIHQGTWLYAAESIGSGLPEYYYDSLAVGPRGVFWANDEGVWVFRDDLPVNILYGRIWAEWRALPLLERRKSVGGYNTADDEYWLAVCTSVEDETWEVWVWSEQDQEAPQWRKYRLDTSKRVTYPVTGIIEDQLHRLLMFGRERGGQSVHLIEWNVEDGFDRDYGNIQPDVSAGITYELESQERGQRNAQMVVTGYQVAIEADSDHKVTVELYQNGLAAASVTSAILGGNNEHIAVRPMRCSTARISIEGEYAGGTRPMLRELTMYYIADTRRRR